MIKQAEHRRLAWLAKQLDPGADAEPAGPDMEASPAADPAAARAAQRKLDKAHRRLEACTRPHPSSRTNFQRCAM